MNGLFQKPFLTDRFDSRGGGIDFLGMRQVNLAMLQEELIPGINNATTDLGTFCLGAWIPWKFQKLSGKADFTLSTYTAFREAIEVAMAYTARDHSPAEQSFGRPRTRMGIENEPRLPGPLSFQVARNRRSGTPRTKPRASTPPRFMVRHFVTWGFCKRRMRSQPMARRPRFHSPQKTNGHRRS